MLTCQQFLAVMDEEAAILKHLHSKLPAGAADYRPSEGQRTTLDLLRYLSMCGIAGTRGMLENNWDWYGDLKARAEAMSFAQFPEALDRQAAEVRTAFAGLSDPDLLTREAKYVTGEMLPLGQALVMAPLRWLTAYRMQLFLYAKACGAADLSTSNLWAGRDPKKA